MLQKFGDSLIVLADQHSLVLVRESGQYSVARPQKDFNFVNFNLRITSPLPFLDSH